MGRPAMVQRPRMDDGERQDGGGRDEAIHENRDGPVTFGEHRAEDRSPFLPPERGPHPPGGAAGGRLAPSARRPRGRPEPETGVWGKGAAERSDPGRGERVSETKGVPRDERGLPDYRVGLPATGDQRDRPTSFLLRATLADCQDLRWRRVENRRLKTGGVLVAQAGVRRMNRADLEGAAPALESKHFRVAKSLRNDRIP